MARTKKEAPLGKRASLKKASRERLLAAARELFEQVGYELATMRGIASACGLSTGAIFVHWGDKESLYHDVMGHAPVSVEEGRELRLALEAQGIDVDALLDPIRTRFAFLRPDRRTDGRAAA